MGVKMNDNDRELNHQIRKLEAINASLAHNKRMARFALLLFVVLGVGILAMLIQHFLNAG
jgi:hypothetical protein